MQNMKNSKIVFVCFLPLIGLFLERYASNKISGIYLWVLVLLLMPVCCLLDFKSLEKSQTDVHSLKKFAVVPPIYIYKRSKLFDSQLGICGSIMLVCFIVSAISLNGFTQGLRINGEVMTESIKVTHASAVCESVDKDCNLDMEHFANAYFGKSCKWSSEKADGGFLIRVSGVKNKDNITIEIKVDFDGYVSGGAKITEVIKNGKKLNKSDKEKFLKEYFTVKSKKTDKNK